MPFSSESGKAFIDEVILKLNLKTGLDLGAGAGTYANRYRSIQWDGVEIWQPYIDKYSLKEKYNTIYEADIRYWEPDKNYDVVVLGDVLEHMTVEEAVIVFNKVKKYAGTIIVSIPIGEYPQDEYDGNPYEKHIVDNWKDEDVRKIFGEPSQYKIDNEIGVYVWNVKQKLKIAVYAISKNEAHFVPRFMEAAKDADIVLIADTGSDDGLPEVAESLGAKVHHICITPWRFDRARDVALSLVPRDIDVCISLDIDEVLQPGWREEIERVWIKGSTTRLRYKFDWGCGIVFYYEKIHARHGYGWKHPCHEYPMPDGRITEVWAQTDMLLAIHKPDPTKSRGQYMDLLELSVKEDPECPRNAFYYARELSFHGRWQDSIDACNRYLKLPRADWPNGQLARG
jgi:hypothetical protein